MKLRHLSPLLALFYFTACHHGPSADREIGHWQVMTLSAKGGMLCYAGSNPVQQSGAAPRDTTPYLMVTRRLSGKSEVSASAGYRFMKSGKVQLMVGDQPYRLYFASDIAWAKDSAEDATIVQGLFAAKSVQLMAVSANHQASTDTYSTDGFAEAVARMKALCP